MRLPIQLQLFCPISVQDFYSLVPLLNNLNIRITVRNHTPHQIFHKADLSVIGENHTLDGKEPSVVHTQGNLAGLVQGLCARL